jgi:hypothetical protein
MNVEKRAGPISVLLLRLIMILISSVSGEMGADQKHGRIKIKITIESRSGRGTPAARLIAASAAKFAESRTPKMHPMQQRRPGPVYDLPLGMHSATYCGAATGAPQFLGIFREIASKKAL